MNTILKSINNELNVSITIINFTEGLQKIINSQKLNVVNGTIFGKFFLNSILINNFNKDKKVDTNFQIKTNGSIKEILINIYDLNKIRGFLKSEEIDFKKIKSSSELLFKNFGDSGELNVFKIKNGKIISNSSIKIESFGVDKIFMDYLKISEQVNSVLTTCVFVDNNLNVEYASGIIIHMLPGFKQKNIDYINEKIGSLEKLNSILAKTKNYNYLIEDIAPNSRIINVDDSFKVQCRCSEEKIKRSISLLNSKEVEDIKKETNEIEVVCEFCKKVYKIKLV